MVVTDRAGESGYTEVTVGVGGEVKVIEPNSRGYFLLSTTHGCILIGF